MSVDSYIQITNLFSLHYKRFFLVHDFWCLLSHTLSSLELERIIKDISKKSLVSLANMSRNRANTILAHVC